MAQCCAKSTGWDAGRQYSGSRPWSAWWRISRALGNSSHHYQPHLPYKAWWSHILLEERQKFSIIRSTWKNARGRHAFGASHTAHHLLLSPALPSSPPLLDRIAVDSTEHQMKWLACNQELCCNKKKKWHLLFKHWNHIQWGEMLPEKHMVLTEVTVRYTSPIFPTAVSVPARRKCYLLALPTSAASLRITVGAGLEHSR